MTDTEGWEVPKARRKTRGPRAQPQTPNPESQTVAKQPRDVPGLTPAALSAEFRSMQKRWKATECRTKLERLLRRRDFAISQAVCLGSGSFSADWEHRYRALWQLVLFVGVVEFLESQPQSKAPITLYAQEPKFTPLDHTLLKTLHITPLSNTASSHITPHTFLFAPFVDWPILLPLFLKHKDPELYIGNEVRGNYAQFASSVEMKGVLDECEEVGRGFLAAREAWRVPEFEEHGSALEGLLVYFRVEEEGEE